LSEAVADRADRIMVFVPMYNCANQIGRVIAQFDEATQRRFSRLVIVDNQSKDDGLNRAAAALAQLRHIETVLLRNDENYGLGGSHKVAFKAAIDDGFDYVVVLHGDDQGSISDLLPLLERKEHKKVDCLLGARFMRGSSLPGYSTFRTLGNRAFNLLYSLATGRRLFDLGAGLNLYSVPALARHQWLRFADDLTFNYYLILASCAWRWKIAFFPLSWREDDQVSNVRLLRQSLRVAMILWQFVIARRRFLDTDHTSNPGRSYTSSLIQSSVATGAASAGRSGAIS